VIFKTSEFSYRGVVPLVRPQQTPEVVRGLQEKRRRIVQSHGTVFTARPDEGEGRAFMPAETAVARVNAGSRRVRDAIKGLAER
jgi:hypothetical protein